MKTNDEKFTVEQVAEALRLSAGIKTAAALMLGCAPNTVKNYIERHPDVLKPVLEQAKSQTTDLAESMLVKAIGKGEAWAICFWLKTQAKDRGYNERKELTGAGGGAIAIGNPVTFFQLPDNGRPH